MRRWIAVSALALAGCQHAATVPVTQARAQLAQSFPDIVVDDVRSAPIAGLLEIYSQGRIVYYAPDENLLLLGDVYGPGGAQLTADRYGAWTGERAALLDLSRAVSVGSGPAELIAFVDPLCSHCQDAVAWIEHRYQYLRVHYFFLPMAPDSPGYAKAVQAACAPDALKREALRQAFGLVRAAGPLLRCAEGEALLAAHERIVKDMGVAQTPTFIARGQTVRGFVPERLDQLLWSR